MLGLTIFFQAVHQVTSRPFLLGQVETEQEGQNSKGMCSRPRLLDKQPNPLGNTAAAAKLLQLCPTLCDPIDGSPLGSSVPGILQARILEWVAISFSNAGK